MNLKSSLVDELRDKAYRDEFVASQVKTGLSFQIRRLRLSRGLTQPQLADAAGMSQPRISEIETPGSRSLTLETLLKVCAAFDVALRVSFIPFSAALGDFESGTVKGPIASFTEELSEATRPSALRSDSVEFSENSAIARALIGTGQKTNVYQINEHATFAQSFSGRGTNAEETQRRPNENLRNFVG